jgi:hypothetical protein
MQYAIENANGPRFGTCGIESLRRGWSGFVILKTRRNGMAKCDRSRMVTFSGPYFVRPWCI